MMVLNTLSNDSVHAAMNFCTIHHFEVDSVTKTLEAVHRVLVGGGLFLLQFWIMSDTDIKKQQDENKKKDVERKEDDIICTPMDGPPNQKFLAYSIDFIVKVAAKVGLEVVDISAPIQYVFEMGEDEEECCQDYTFITFVKQMGGTNE